MALFPVIPAMSFVLQFVDTSITDNGAVLSLYWIQFYLQVIMAKAKELLYSFRFIILLNEGLDVLYWRVFPFALGGISVLVAHSAPPWTPHNWDV